MLITVVNAELGLRRARAIGRDQAMVVGRRQLYAAGVPRWLVRRELRVGRWQRGGRQSVVLHNGPLSVEAARWVAVIESGPRAAISGVTALQQDGVTGLGDETIHVLVAKGTALRRLPGVDRHESRRWREQDIVTTGLRRTTPAVSAVLAALWAVTERQAVFFLVLPVQQRRCTAADLAEVLERVRRHRFRRALWRAVGDIADGARSVGELDVGRGLARRGLPRPDRQVRRTRADGTVYLDLEWEAHGLSMEVDGEQHDLPWMRLADTVRDLDTLAEGKTSCASRSWPGASTRSGCWTRSRPSSARGAGCRPRPDVLASAPEAPRAGEDAVPDPCGTSSGTEGGSACG